MGAESGSGVCGQAGNIDDVRERQSMEPAMDLGLVTNDIQVIHLGQTPISALEYLFQSRVPANKQLKCLIN